jgi:hypothetical protein
MVDFLSLMVPQVSLPPRIPIDRFLGDGMMFLKS